jgi:hypothetical protein
MFSYLAKSQDMIALIIFAIESLNSYQPGKNQGTFALSGKVFRLGNWVAGGGSQCFGNPVTSQSSPWSSIPK